MAFQPSGSTLLDIRHRIQEITIQPATSESPIKLEILVDGQTVHKLSTIDPNQTLHWHMQTYPCDVHQDSTIGLKFIEKHHTSPDREVFVKYTFSDAENETSITTDAGPFPSRWPAFGLMSKRPNTTSAATSIIVTVKFLDFNQIANNYPNALDRATKMVEETRGPLDKLGNSRETLKTILGFGVVAAELHPIAKLVIGICAKAWEHLEKIQKQHEDLQRLLDGLTQMQPFINAVKKRAQEAVLKHVVLGLLKLIEDASNYIINSMHRTSAGRTKDGFSYTRESRWMDELLERLRDLKEQFDRGIGVQLLNQVLSTEQRALINQLKPAASSPQNTMPSPCHEGTRTEVIADIQAWHLNPNNPQKLLWLYGQAGMGKSSIAASVCQVFKDTGALGAHFFFKRDDSYLRSPEHMLNIIVHRLALQYEPYGQAVASAIEDYSGLLDMPLGQRYVDLVEHPLKSLGSTIESPSKTFVIVVDALDECENTKSRRSLFTYLRTMSQLAPWIKIVVTSRPDEDIKAAFDSTAYSYVASRSIASYDASSDILKYTQIRMNEMTNHKKRPRWSDDSVRELSTRAAGLFIWVETACKFIERGADMKKRLEQVLAGTQPAEGSAPLDLLYTTAIKQAMGDEGSDNVRVFRECIGAIVATGTRKPLPVASLESLLSGHIGPGVFDSVVSGLGSVLYEDARQGGAVRVYHPSFADFILDPFRSGSFYTDPREQSTVLADCSLSVMMRELRFNICGLETSHVLNCDIINLETRVQTAIEPHLAYSCLHWSGHLTETPNGTLQNQLVDFLYGKQLLYWIEAMSLLGRTSTALLSLLELINWVSDTMGDLSSYVNDAYRFILLFYDAISQSTPHLYISALPFAPTRSKLAQQMRPLFPNTFITTRNTHEGWPAWLQSIPHNSAVDSVACSSNGRQILSGCRDGTMRLWDSETGAAMSEPLGGMSGHHVAISSDGQRVASGSEEGVLEAWDIGTGAKLDGLSSLGCSYLVHLALSSDGNKLFCVGIAGDMFVWDINTGAQLCKLIVAHGDSTSSDSFDDDTVWSAAISPNEKFVASGCSDGTVRLWDITTGNLLTEFILSHSNKVWCVAFSPDGSLLAAGSNDATVRIWEVGTGKAFSVPMFGHSDRIRSVAFSPDGRYIVSGSSDMIVRLWDVETGMPACNPLLGHTGQIFSVTFCSNGHRIVSASEDKTALIWDVRTSLTAPPPLAGHTGGVNSVSFSSDGRYLASGSDDETIRVWDAQSGGEAFMPLNSHLGVVRFVAFIPNSRHILSWTGRKTIGIHDMDTSTLITSFTLSNLDELASIALSPNGQRLASGFAKCRVGVWDAKTGVAIFTPKASHSCGKSAVIFSPNGRFVASGYDDEVRIWDAETGTAVGEPLRKYSHMSAPVCFSPDSRRVASGVDGGTVQVWNAETGAMLFEPLPGQEDWTQVYSIAFTPDGRYIISGMSHGKVQIQDAETGSIVVESFEGHLDGVMAITLSPDGRRIATGSEDNTVRVWDMENLRARDRLLVEELFKAPLKRSVSTSVLAHYANEAGWVASSRDCVYAKQNWRGFTSSLILRLATERLRLEASLK